MKADEHLHNSPSTWKIASAILSAICIVLGFLLWQEHKQQMMQAHEPSADFDRSFIDMMIPHNQQAIDEAKRALAQAKHEDLKELAIKIVSTRELEMDQMQYWRKLWFGAHE
ncbi:MAG: DUF305 domain-containing protein [Candidatus Obscuribacterales bacterium]|nr:DUF305 domain-containing protein [Candidatus Obscuribacterales bacterium]